MNPELKLLLLEDDLADAELIQKLLKRAGMEFSAVVASDEGEFLEALEANGYHAVLADNALPQYSSMEALELIRATNPHVAFILVTGTVSEEFAVNIIQQGADDYILKTNLTRLPAAITNAIEKKRIKREKEVAERETGKEKELSISIINSLPGIFYLCDSEGKFLRWNKNFERISGYNSAEIKKMTTEYFFTTQDKEYFSRFMKKSFATGHGETEAFFTTRDTRKIPYYFTSMAISYEDTECLICVGLDISAGKESEKQLQLLNGELHRISAHLENIREKEQARIAREIHDQLGQQLTGLKMDLAWLQRRLDNDEKPEVLTEKLRQMSGMLDETVTTVRKVAADLRPSILDDFGLIEALDWQSREFEKRSGIPVSFWTSEEKNELTPAMSIGLFRIYQEVLTNVARHAEANSIKTSLEFLPGQLFLTIADDGKGFDPAIPTRSLGLLGMKERAYMFGGTIKIESEPGKGTTILISVPLDEEDKE
ncbi:MAG: histidine kinase [Bacteroidota bacterium]